MSPTMKDSPFYNQARLMLETMPHVAKEDCFALKGGTAINLFLQDMPRLSVDIDLTYLYEEDRETFLKNLERALQRIATSIQKAISDAQIHSVKLRDSGRLYKLVVTRFGANVKIEPNLLLRGTVYPCEERELSQKAQDLFELATSIRVLSNEDLYGGKICAALDRQHPRDFFDIKFLLEKIGLTEKVRKAFVVYLASHNRPMSELLEPKFQDLREIFQREFVGMTAEPIAYEELVVARDELLRKLRAELSIQERQFLLSVKEGKPEWDLLGIEGLEKLPGLQWKLMNIKKMNPKKHQESSAKLRKILEI